MAGIHALRPTPRTPTELQYSSGRKRVRGCPLRVTALTSFVSVVQRTPLLFHAAKANRMSLFSPSAPPPHSPNSAEVMHRRGVGNAARCAAMQRCSPINHHEFGGDLLFPFAFSSPHSFGTAQICRLQVTPFQTHPTPSIVCTVRESSVLPLQPFTSTRRFYMAFHPTNKMNHTRISSFAAVTCFHRVRLTDQKKNITSSWWRRRRCASRGGRRRDERAWTGRLP